MITCITFDVSRATNKEFVWLGLSSNDCSVTEVDKSLFRGFFNCAFLRLANGFFLLYLPPSSFPRQIIHQRMSRSSTINYKQKWRYICKPETHISVFNYILEYRLLHWQEQGLDFHPGVSILVNWCFEQEKIFFFLQVLFS